MNFWSCIISFFVSPIETFVHVPFTYSLYLMLVFIFPFLTMPYRWIEFGFSWSMLSWYSLGLSKNLASFSTWSILKIRLRQESGMKWSAISQGSRKWTTIVIPWRYSSRFGSRSILKPWTGEQWRASMHLSSILIRKQKYLEALDRYQKKKLNLYLLFPTKGKT